MNLDERDLEQAAIFAYRLKDGSYVMAEEVDYDFDANIIYVINPVSIELEDSRVKLTQWCITDHSEPVVLRDEAIIATHKAPMTLKRNYFQWNLFHMLSQVLPPDEFNEIFNMFSAVVDSKDSKESQGFDFNKPFKVKKIKKEEKENPWDRY